MTAYRPLAALVVAAVVSMSCGGGSSGNSPTGTSNYPGTDGTPQTPGTNQVIATTGAVFNPSSLSVSAGTAVTFTFESLTHNVTFDVKPGAPANIGDTAGNSVARTFATAGSYPYRCTIHPGMSGTVTVN